MKSDSEDFNLNIPPFYPGEEIICVDDFGAKRIKKGNEYIAEYCGVECSCGVIVGLREVPGEYSDGRRIESGDKFLCERCNSIGISYGDRHGYRVTRFVSKKTLTSPPMSFSKIEEKEKTVKKPQILIPN